MKTMIIALSAAALIAVGPAVLAQNVSGKTLDQQHQVSKKHHRLVSGYAPRYAMHAKGLKTGYPAFGYTPSEPKDYTYDMSRYGGGGGGGGGGSGM